MTTRTDKLNLLDILGENKVNIEDFARYITALVKRLKDLRTEMLANVRDARYNDKPLLTKISNLEESIQNLMLAFANYQKASLQTQNKLSKDIKDLQAVELPEIYDWADEITMLEDKIKAIKIPETKELTATEIVNIINNSREQIDASKIKDLPIGRGGGGGLQRGVADKLYRQKRVVTVTQSATPKINTNILDVAYITGLAQAVTSFTTNLSGSPLNGDSFIIDITDDGTGRALTWGASFEDSGTITLPSTTVASTRMQIGFRWNISTQKWTCVGVA